MLDYLNVKLIVFDSFVTDCWITEVGIKHKHFSVMIFQVKEKRKAEVEDKFLQQSPLKSTFKLSSSHFQKPFFLSDCTKVESSKSPVKQNC